MTACVNRKHSRRVAAVISASLVGALSLGIAPVAAMANDGIETLTATDVTEIRDGEITSAIDENKDEITDLGNIEFVADGDAHYVDPVTVTTKVNEYDVKKDGLQVVYYEVASGTTGTWFLDDDGSRIYVTTIDKDDITAAGDYIVGVMASGAALNASQMTYLEFSLVAPSLENAKITDVDGNELIYNGGAWTYGASTNGFYLSLGDKTLSGGVDFATVDIFKGNDPVQEGNLVDAGDYVARITATDGKTYDVDFKIAPIDLTNAVLGFNAGGVLTDTSNLVSTGTSTLPEYVDVINGLARLTQTSGEEGTSHVGDTTVKLSFVSASNGQKAPSTAKGAYTYKVTAYKTADPDKASTNIVGEQEITFIRYEKAATFEYDNEAWPTTTATTPVKRFSEDYITVRGGGKKLDAEVAYAKYVNGTWVGVDKEDTQWPGTYRATVTAVDGDYTYGGTEEIFFKVDSIDVVHTDVYVTYMGEVIEDGDVVDVYSGEDISGNLSIKAFDEDGEEIPASEFDIVITEKGSDEALESVVDAGDYTVTVKNRDDSMYRIQGDNDVDFSVLQVVSTADATDTDTAQVRLAGTIGYGPKADQTYTYTGEAVVPSFEYDLIWGRYADDEDWKALDADTYRVEYQRLKDGGNEANGSDWKDVDECVEAGTYRAVLTDNAKDDNHVIDGTYVFYVSADRVFLDVANDFWAAEDIYTADSNEWMTGYGDGLFFGPNDNIKRGDVAVVLWKMAGKPGVPTDSEDSYDENSGYKTGFDDVDGTMYYAEAIAWAKRSGIVSGDTGTGKFRPEDTISRQELAKMLSVYAEKCGEDVVTDTDAVLGAYEDANTVSEWAEAYVAYLVEAGVMGNESPLRGTDPITRAEVATMVVRLSDQFDFHLIPRA